MVILLLGLLGPSAWALECDSTGGDGDVAWNGLRHDSFAEADRSPFGAVPHDIGTVSLGFRTCAGDAERVRVRLWDAGASRESWLDAVAGPIEADPDLGAVQRWTVSVPVPRRPTILYYFFEVSQGADTDYYVDDDPELWGGGTGMVSDGWDDGRSFQISVYDPDFETPTWWREGLVYQIFPDRFRDGDPANNPVEGGGWAYGGETDKVLVWDEPLAERCAGADQSRAQCFAGGDLQGIIGELDGLAELGVTTLSLNPIFLSPTNHRYDTQSWMEIDPELGTLADFDLLVDEAEARGMRLVLDGVFNHLSADSPAFDLYSRWDADGALVSPAGPGANDGSGACEDRESPYRRWFSLPDRGAAGRDERTGETVRCAAGETYEAWGTYFHLPKLNDRDIGVRAAIWGAPAAPVPYWIGRGAAGWRLDVAPEIDGGVGNDPTNPFWEGFRGVAKDADPEVVLIAEEWGDASSLLLGEELDATMNYRWRSIVLDYLFDGCSGSGCGADGFRDNDSAPWRPLGSIDPLDEAGFVARLEALREDMPPPAFAAQLNLLGSHDVSRIDFLLRKISSDDASVAEQKLRFATLFQYSYPGVPVIYYGDEVGIVADSVWDGSIYQDDPYNRATMPWADLGGSPDLERRAWFERLGALRAGHPALRSGEFAWGVVDGDQDLITFSRTNADEELIIVLHRGLSDRTVNLNGLGLAEGSQLIDLLDGAGGAMGGEWVVGAGSLEITFGGLSTAILRVSVPETDSGGEADGEGGEGTADGGAEGEDDGGSETASEGREEKTEAGCGGCATGRVGALGAWFLAVLGAFSRRR